jgi:hypothetical protein
MARKIPTSIIAVVSEALANRHSHAEIDQVMEAAGLEMNPLPGGNRQVKTRAWFNHANETLADPLGTLGKIVAEFMERDSEWDERLRTEQERVQKRSATMGCHT